MSFAHRSPTRSERLLRDTLHRDNSRSKSTSPKDEHTPPSFLFRSTSVSSRRDTTPSKPARPYSYSSSTASTTSRPNYSSRRSSTDSIKREHATLVGNAALTPHEQVLRARLECVLRAGEGVLRAENLERARGNRKRRPSVSDQRASEIREEHGWLRRSTSLRSSPYIPSQFKAEPTLTIIPPKPTTPPPSKTHSTIQSHSRSQSSDMSDIQHVLYLPSDKRNQRQQEPLTPPPTPPLDSSTHLPSLQGHHPMFNVRRASARCRQIEGYVSFAAVEGLGEPPGCSGFDEEEATTVESKGNPVAPRKTALGLGIGKIWKVLGEVGGKLTE